MKIKSIIYLLLPLLFWQCERKKVSMEYFSNGHVKVESEFVNGKKNGISRIYYQNGDIHVVHHYVNDKINGTSTFFHKGGRIAMFVEYKNGIKDGPYQIFFPNGYPSETGSYLSNNKRGKIIQYFQNDSAVVRAEVYSLDSSGIQRTYYIKYFDEYGNLTSQAKPLSVILPGDGFSVDNDATIKFRISDQGYDSSAIFSELRNLSGTSLGALDVVEFKNNEAALHIRPVRKGSFLFGGKWILYKKEEDKDSVYQYTTIGYFEEPIKIN